MTVPSTLSLPTTVLAGGATGPVSGAPAADGSGTDGPPATDAFALLLAAMAGGVVVPAQAPLPPADLGTGVEDTAQEAAAGLAALPATASPVAWEATTQRAHVPGAPAADPTGSTTPHAAADPEVPPQVRRAAGLESLAEALPASGPMTDQLAERSGAPAAAPATDAPAVAPPGLQVAGLQVAGLQVAGLQVAGLQVAGLQVAAAGTPPPAAHLADDTAPAGRTHAVQPALLEAARGLRDEGGGRTSLVVRLDPPELGAVVVRLTVQDGRVDVQVRTPDVTARGDLQAQSYDVQRVLRENGLDLSSFDVAHGGEHSSLSDLASGSRGDAGTPDRGTPQRGGGTDGHAGNSHVTDDVADPQPAGTWL